MTHIPASSFDHPSAADLSTGPTAVPSPSPAKKKRGAPLGNRNRLKHGFYSRRFLTAEIKDLENGEHNLDDEIKLIRIYLRRLTEKADTFTSLEQGMEFLRALSMATYTISRLVRMRQVVGPVVTDLLSRAMDEAIVNIRNMKGWK
jgi:hypothetical protein